MILVSPTEPPRYVKEVEARGAKCRVSSLPERHGVDFLWWGFGGMRCGVQRKRFPDDFLASRGDGRLQKEVHQMQALDYAVLIQEGRGIWTLDGQLTDPHYKLTFAQYLGMMASIQVKGINTFVMGDTAETVAALVTVYRWSRKGKHQSLERRPGPRTDAWGGRDSKAWATHMLQSIDGIGPELAERIWDMYGLPLKWTLNGVEDLEKVKGIGAPTARRIWAAIETVEGDQGQ